MGKKKNNDEAQTPEAPAEQSPMTADEARQILLQEQNAKANACMQEVDAVLRRHQCALDVQMTVTTRGCTPSIRVIPAPPQG
jgi:hypothetical protein